MARTRRRHGEAAARRETLGARGEQVAVEYLVRHGGVVLARNWWCRFGEIDVVVREGGAIVVCEVKTRSGDGYGTPLDAVTPAKAARLRRLAREWLRCWDRPCAQLRIDVLGVRCLPAGGFVVERLRGVA